VLLVEDDDDLRENLEFLLSRRGFDVAVAANGQEALAKIDRDDPPCLIITDLMMPVMDGWELAKTLEADPELSTIPVILCSGVADLAKKARDLTAIAHFTKPVDLPRLYDLVREHC
jgi:CheY-like chemotaxis protein